VRQILDFPAFEVRAVRLAKRTVAPAPLSPQRARR
jgi:hypothetical protein